MLEDEDGVQEAMLEQLPFELEKHATNPIVIAALANERSIEKCVAEVNAQLATLQIASLGSFAETEHLYTDLHKDIDACDTDLQRMEEVLTAFQTDLSAISCKIKKLQETSVAMNVQLKNRRLASEVLDSYLRQIVLTPELVIHICEGTLDNEYLSKLREVTTKLEHSSQPSLLFNPSVMASKPELERLKLKAVQRIRDMLINSILQLKKPKTNVQIMQRNVLLTYKTFFLFLKEQHPSSADEVVNTYTAVLRQLYLMQFRSYVISLQRLQLEVAPAKHDVVGHIDSGGAAASQTGARQVLDALGFASKPQNLLHGRGNVFSLAGREDLLSALDGPPIVAHAIGTSLSNAQSAPRFYPEQLFRSHQKLLIDTVTSEFLFIVDFFTLEDETPIFNEIFSRTFAYFLESMEHFAACSMDSIALLLMARINEWNRYTMQRRRITSLDSYIDSIQNLLWPRFRMVIDAHVESLERLRGSTLLAPDHSQRTRPHYITRRYAELYASLLTLSTPLAGAADCPDDILLNSMQSLTKSMLSLLEDMSREIPAKRDRLIFHINNYDFVTSLIKEKHHAVNDTITRFEKLQQESVSMYVNDSLQQHFVEILQFVERAEVVRSTSGAAAIDATDFETVVGQFNQSWRSKLDIIHADALRSFTNFNGGTSILKQILTILLLYNTRLHKLFETCNIGGATSKLLVANTAIANEFRKRAAIR